MFATRLQNDVLTFAGEMCVNENENLDEDMDEKEKHEHHHHEHGEGGIKQKIAVVAVSAALLVAAMIVEHSMALPVWQLLIVYMVPYLLVGQETLHEAVEGLTEGDALNEHFLMSVATIGALCIGFMPGAEPQMAEAVFVMLFFQVGELFEEFAEGRSRRSIAHLMDIRPDVARVAPLNPPEERAPLNPPEGGRNDAARERMVRSESVGVGSIIIVRPGEKVPLDGVIIEGTTTLNTVALTGESMPRGAGVGDTVLSGCINLTGAIRVRTTKSFGESTASKIIRLVEDAAGHKSKSETFITRFARVYTPVVVALALLIAIVPPLLSSVICHLSFSEALTTWLYRALLFLVVSCPCALVISVPLTFFGGIGGASRKGILVKGANYLDVLAKVDTVVFDKTGTLTEGQFAVNAVHDGSEKCKVKSESSLLHLAAHVEHYSTHPIGAALRAAFPEAEGDGCSVTDVEETAGHGVQARVGGHLVCVGNEKMMESIGALWHECSMTGSIIHMAIDGEYAGHIVVGDRIKDDSAEAVSRLRQLGVRRTVMLTGDAQEVADGVARQLGIDEWHAQLLPADKVAYMEKLTSHLSPLASHLSSTTAFVGDGINDAPVLALADVGIAMGALGSDAAIEAADVVLMDDRPSKIATAIALARRTLRIARQNVAFAIGVKVAVLLLAVVGIATMWMAVFADVGVTVLAVLNAMRALSSR